jgi:hypothetical protein
MSWSGGIAEWTEEKKAYISVAFSWKVPAAYMSAIWHTRNGYEVHVGGPGIWANKKIFKGIAKIGGEVDALARHNIQATIASRGCSVGCWFCIVPAMEGKEFNLIWDFEPRPILCDNNLSALPIEFQDHIIKRYQEKNTKLIDANSGFEARTFDQETYKRWGKINHGPWRFALDEKKELEEVRRAMKIVEKEPAYKKRIYILIGNEPMSECFERITKAIEWGGEPHCQPYIPMNSLVKKPMIKYDWTEQRLKDMARWANRKIWRKTKIQEYKNRKNETPPFKGINL